jgi:hypothetical protein
VNLKASQRRAPARPRRPLHLTLAQRQAWQQRLIHSGGAALTLSVVAWLLGLSLPLHLGLTGLGLLLGLGWRFRETGRRAERWAFGWIEARSGLAYLTAHELARTPNPQRADPYGFGEAVRARAARASSLEAPPLQPWFLPLVVLALALALLPHLALPALQAPFASPSGSPLEAPAPAPAESAFNVGDEASAEEKSAESTASTPETGTPETPESSAADPDAERSFDTASGTDELSTVEGEQDALNRFLERTQDAEVGAMQAQQGPRESGAPTQSSQGGAPGEAVAGAESRAAPEDATGTPADAEANAEAAPDDLTAAEGGRATDREPGTDQSAASDADPEANGDPALSEREEEEGVSAEGPEAPQEAPSTNEEQRAQASTPETDRTNEALARTGEPTVQRSAAANEDDEEITQDIRDGQSGERAGTRAGLEVEGSRERLGGPERAAERLSGIQGDGPTTLGGEALQQGGTPEALPPTAPPESYRRAAEEVIREGRIPLEYQNIVRDYFR